MLEMLEMSLFCFFSFQRYENVWNTYLRMRKMKENKTDRQKMRSCFCFLFNVGIVSWKLVSPIWWPFAHIHMNSKWDHSLSLSLTHTPSHTHTYTHSVLRKKYNKRISTISNHSKEQEGERVMVKVSWMRDKKKQK